MPLLSAVLVNFTFHFLVASVLVQRYCSCSLLWCCWCSNSNSHPTDPWAQHIHGVTLLPPNLANGNQTEANLLIGDTFCPNRFETNRPALPLSPPPAASILYQCLHQIFSPCLQWEEVACALCRQQWEEIKWKNRWLRLFPPPAFMFDNLLLV